MIPTVVLLLPLLAASTATDQIERWAPLVLLLVAAGIGYLRYQERKKGPDPEDDEDW